MLYGLNAGSLERKENRKLEGKEKKKKQDGELKKTPQNKKKVKRKVKQTFITRWGALS